MEDRALGFAAAAHAQLADAPAGPRLRRRGPGRVHGRPGADRVPGALRRARRRARANAHHRHVGVAHVRRGYLVETDAGSWEADGGRRRQRRVQPTARAGRLGVAAGASSTRSPRSTTSGPSSCAQVAVLVVGASATGLQLADELLRSGREVTVAVGEHVRMPRTYRGRDIMWWLEQIGRLDERYDEVDDLVRARHVPSPQLVGTPDRADLDLNALTARGASLVGRLGGRERQHRLVLRLAAQRLQPRRPQAQAPARHDRPMGRHRPRPPRRADARRRAPAGPDRPGPTASTRCSGPPASAPTTPGWSPGDRSQGRDPPRRRRGPARARGSTGSG